MARRVGLVQGAPPPDAELVDRLRDGDEAAFALLLDQWSPGMLRLARSFVSTPDSAIEPKLILSGVETMQQGMASPL